MAKVITMGEIMLRLSTPNTERFIQADEFDVCYGGGEANVAVSLAITDTMRNLLQRFRKIRLVTVQLRLFAK